ncbi:DUF4325 domain-containing protein [Pseudomonas sp. Ga0074129]|uniref:STAS-like domain-containing protein n=1 Tax=Pseudomonas sp. Ga0074129 TaxID=1752219 RepID=UPI000A6D9B66|nr:DUF4325 domain-containing protein [Pseudomonas sp. Ga0074129]
MAILNIGKDFSTDPAGRFYSDGGDSSGEEFREDHLLPALKQLTHNEKLEIIIDDSVEGYGSSFLVEGFAGLVKYGYMTAEDLLGRLQITHTNPEFEFYKNKILQYINEAKYNSKKYTPTTKPK